MTALRVNGPSGRSTAFRVGANEPSRVLESGTASQPSETLWNLKSNEQDHGTITSISSGYTPEADAVKAARSAARSLVRQIPKAEREALYREHADLTEKLFVDDLSPSERKRVRYLEWQIDRFEDADVGDYLDDLDVLVSAHERISEEISRFALSAQAAKRGGRR